MLQCSPQKDNNHITITYNTIELHWCNHTLKRSPVAEKSHHWSSMQKCIPFYSPDPRKSTQATFNTRTKTTILLQNIIRTHWPKLSQNQEAMDKMACPIGKLHTNYLIITPSKIAKCCSAAPKRQQPHHNYL
jgi:hypothetical protein